MRFTSSALAAALLCVRRSSLAFGVSKSTAGASSRSFRTLTSRRRTKNLLFSNTQSQQCMFPATPAWLPFTLQRGGAARMSSTTADVEVDPVGQKKPKEIFRQDYKPLPYLADTVELDVDIQEGTTRVQTTMNLIRNPAAVDPSEKRLSLDGDAESVTLKEIKLNGRVLQQDVDYDLTETALTLKELPLQGDMIVETTVTLVPEDNTQLSGLYKSGSMYCTQMEAMGFRRFTYFPDRPDNMAKFTKVRIEADKTDYPILLSNGNLLEEGSVEGGARHYAVWQDPFPKPSYLFAVVAGNLGVLQDTYTTASGRTVKLQVLSEHENVHQLDYAMDSLKRSMKWDEDRFGLEYDLDLYNVVAVESFNMGAMENKGLNVFNTAYVLADPKTATDTDYERVEGVIGHEYFHNWTGNRVTCRDWFQLTLKEGLTVFRDQEFSGDMNSKAVNRIQNVRGLRGRQFSEDAGPMSHPIRPESYISMDNFYTATVYTKGSEVIRMYQTILGVDGFNKGLKLYLETHDGSAATCDDFLKAMADANGVDLSQFALWYSTPGTPVVKYSGTYDNGSYSITLSQESNAPEPMHIPVTFGLLDNENGKEIVESTVLNLKEAQQTFTFDGLNAKAVVPSILRTFSAPVKLERMDNDQSEEEKALAFLAAYDTDGFNRWDSGQRLYSKLIFQQLSNEVSDKTLRHVYEAFGRTLQECTSSLDFSIQAFAMILPSESTLAEDMEVVDPIGLHNAHKAVKKMIAQKYVDQVRQKYDELTKATTGVEFKVDAESIGQRRLRNVLLEYLCCALTDQDKPGAAALAMRHYESASGMTDKMAALNALVSMEDVPEREQALQKFYDDANGDALVLNKWFTVQALADLPDVLNRVKQLKGHPDFTLLNPNRCRSLIGAFTMNSAAFHQEGGAGYEFLGSILLELDSLNPQVSSRMASSLIQWKRYDETRGQLMKAQLERLLESEKLSDDLFEIVTRGLK